MNTRFILRLMLTAMAVLCLAGAAQAQVSLRFEPDDGSVVMGQNQRLGIWLDDALEVRTIELTVNYDETLLASVEGGPGAAFDALDPAPTIWEDFDDGTPGQWSGYAVIFGGTSYVTGPGELFYWEAQGLYPGTAGITSASVALYDELGAQIADVTLDPTTLEVLPPFDDPVFDAEPAYTMGLANTVSWNDVGATEYQVQAASDPDFNTLAGDSGWISATSYEFTGLTHGQTYHYRVKARTDSPAYEGDWAAGVVFSTQDDQAPGTMAGPLDTYQTSLTFDVPWTASDPQSGLASLELYVDSGSGYTLYDTVTDPAGTGVFSFTAGSEGSYSFYTRGYDNVGNAEAAPGTADASTMVDVTAPSGDLLVNGGATLTNDPAVTLTSSVTGAFQMQFSNDDASYTEWEAFAAERAWDLTAGDGEKTVYGRYRDEAGNVYTTSAVITLDTTPPAETFVINGDAGYTNDTAVTLTMSGSDAAQMRFSNDGAVWSEWTGYAAEQSWDLPAVDGELTVYGEFRDEAGNVSQTTDTIVLDTEAPVADFVIDGDAVYATGLAVSLEATSADAAQMRYSNDGSTWSEWAPFAASYAWDLAAGDGSKLVYGQFRDLAGNVSGASDAIILDTAAPEGGFVVNGDDTYTTTAEVTLTSAVTGAFEMQFSSDGVTWSGWTAYAETAAFTLAGPDGENTVYGQYRDEAGNLLEASDAIILDTAAPEGGFVINGDDTYTSNPNVTLDITVTGASEMQFSQDGVTWSGWGAYAATFPWELTGPDGEQTIYGQFRDEAGNLLEAADAIILDTLPPGATLVVAGDAAYTTTAEVELNLAGSDAVQMQFSNDGVTWSDWTAFAATYPWTLAGPDGENTVYGQFRDAAGNVAAAQDAIILDTVAPEAAFVINGDAIYTTDAAVTLDITVTGASEMQFSDDGVTWSDWTAAAATYPWTLPGPDGELTVYGQFRDEAGNVTAAQDLIILDTAAPVGNFVINGDDPYTTDPAVTLTLAVTGAAEMQVSNDGASWSAWVPYADTYGWTLEGADGEKTVQVRLRDEAGNLADILDTIILDTAAPAATLTIAGGADYTSELLVNLDLTTDDAVEMQFSNDGVSWSGWTAFAATYEWTLAGPDGENTVYGQFRDAAGNVTEASDTIILDTVAPEAAFVIDGDAVYTTDAAVTLDITVTGASEMQFSDDGVTWSDWTAVAATYPWTLPGPDGELTVYGRFRDEAGNTTSAQDAIILDTTAPEAALVINDDAEYTNDPAVTLGISAGGATEMQFSGDGATWSDWTAYAETYPWTLDGADGEKTVYGRFRDEAGNEVTVDDTIVLDTTAPDATFVVNNDDAYTTDPGVTLQVTAIGATQMQFSGDGVTWSDWTAVADTYPWTLDGADGEKTVYGQFRDAAGNVTAAQDAIILDTVAPEADFVINLGAPYTNDPAVTLNITATGASEMQFSNDGVSWSGWTAYADTYGWTLETGDGEKTVYGQFRDAAGNVTAAQDDITLDSTAPDASLVINAGDDYTTQAEVTLYLTSLDAVEMQFSSDGVTWSGWTAYADTYGWTLEGPDGEKTVYGQFRDAAENVVEAQDTIILDTTAPEAAFVINNDDPYTTDAAVTLNITATGASEMQFSSDGATWSGWTAVAATYGWSLEGGDGEKTVSGRFRDAAGNLVESSDTIILDTVAPEAAFVVNGDDTYTTDAAVTLDITATGADQMRFSNDGAGWSDWTAVAATYGWTLDVADGEQTVYGQFRDEAGNVTAAEDGIILDGTAPVSVAGPLDEYQTSLTFSVPWTGSDAVSGLQTVELFVNDGSGWTSAGITSEVDSPMPFTFTAATPGTYSFYTVATDNAGLVEAAPAEADAATTVDVTAPEGTLVINGDAPWATTEAVTLNLAVTGAAQMRFSDDNVNWSEWTAYADTHPWTLPGPDGEQTVYGQLRDAAGNVLEVSDSILLDTSPPEGTLTINGDAAVTASTVVTLDVVVSGAEEMRFSNDGATWTEWLPFAVAHPWTLSEGDGVKTVYGELRDTAGHVLEVQDDITLDTTAPDVPVIVAEPAFTAGTSNTVSWNPTGGTGYMVEAAVDADFADIQATTGWITNTFFEFTGLTDGQTYWYRVKARDELDNESAWSGTVFSTQDATAPASTAGPLDAFQAALTFDVPWTAGDATSGVASVELFYDDGSGWTSYGTTTEVDPPAPFSFTAAGEGSYGFYLVARDAAGNVEGAAGTAEVSTTVDLTAPEGTVAINGGDETTADVAVTLTSAVTDLNGVTEMRFSNDGADWSAWTAYAAEYPWTVTEGDGEKTVTAEYRDPAGNVLQTGDTIVLDTTPPGVPSFLAEPEFTAGTTNLVSWNATEAVAYFVQRAGDAGFTDIQANSGWVMATEFHFTGLEDGQTYWYRVKARDELENETDWAAAVFSTQDNSRPVSSADPMPTYQGTTEITISWTGSDQTSGLASVELFVSFDEGWTSAGLTTQVDPPEPFTYTAAEAGTYRFYTLATDVAGNVEVNLGTVDAYTTVDLSAPEAVSALDATSDLPAVNVTWTNPEATDLDEVEVWAALWTQPNGTSAYPEYDDIADAPARPASRAAAEADPQWTLLATLDSDAESWVHGEGMDVPGVYCYEIFLRDFAGNYSLPATEGARSINYLLGDITGDGEVDVFDITKLGAAYGTVMGDAGYNNLVDVGPTDDGSPLGVPLTDNEIQFEDLTIMALNYGLEEAPTKVSGSELPALTWYQEDETTWILGLLEPCANLKAVNLVAELPEGVTVEVEAGADLGGDFDYFLGNIAAHGLDAGLAVLGRDAVLPVSGELLRVTTSAEADLARAVVRARDLQNESLTVNLSAEPIQVVPEAYRLAGNYPNPFNPQTTIAFDLPEDQKVSLNVYDLKGRLIRELVHEALPAGSHSVIWNGTDRSGRRVASGVYFYRIDAGPLQAVKRMMLVK